MKNRVTLAKELFLKLFNVFLNNGYPKYILKQLIYNLDIYGGAIKTTSTSDFKYRNFLL